MRSRIGSLPTHTVENQPPPLENLNLFETDLALREALAREGGGWAEPEVREFGRILGRPETIRLGFQANRHPPELRAFDPYGFRIDEVEYHPAYHELMALGVRHGVPSVAWTAERGGHVVHAALEYLLAQVEAGVCCPLTMTYAVVPSLRHEPELASFWEPLALSREYDPRPLPAHEKRGVTMGMAMTEKQGGSDVRANTTQARPLEAPGPGKPYELRGHKWFCSAPMSDAFLTLAYTEKNALTCFLVPRWLPDGRKNRIFLQRLKDKLGNRSNASSEIEYDGACGYMVGPEGRGVRTIIEMVQHTRLDCVVAGAALMRQALVQALHHARHRKAFGALLSEKSLMQNVLADLALEAEAATALALRLARAFDESPGSQEARGFARLATAVGKYWVNKRAPEHIYEAMECLGGNGYVEESILPRLYREAPVNSIWEGSGNVICLDVLRAIAKEPGSLEAFFAEVADACAEEPLLAEERRTAEAILGRPDLLEREARRLVESMALLLQGSLLRKHAPREVADAFLVSRLGRESRSAYGTLPSDVDFQAILTRALPVS
ncbi:MAG: acyl-CoA dehydrogenase [Candidatus Binatia bacterium]|nr:MAG: acyl-CoA dehydrogenase [Candidatus Binatia bacterium]